METFGRQGRKKPFFLRWWIYGPVALLVVTALTAWLFWIFLNVRFERRAAEFDLSQLERMEAASIIYDRQGKELGKIFIQNRNPVSLDKISQAMVKAVVAAEDNKFFQHHGVDYSGVLRAALANYRRGKISQGASTVTQQLARNSFELRERTYQRKLVEMFLARRIEQKFSKGKIMELYLNRVYFGSGFYGVEAAARGYFGRSAKDLDIGQCAMLAGLLKSPQTLSPWNNKEGAKMARDFVLRRMREQGLISKADYKEQVGLPLYVMKRTNPFKVSYAIDYIRQQAIAALGYRRAMNGGFHIYTTLDLKLQRAAELAVRELLTKVEAQAGYDHVTFEDYRKLAKPIEEELNRGNMLLKLPEPKYLQGAVLALENSTAGILAMVGGRDFKHSEYNRATMARRPIGTAFTPFVYAAAYEKGIFPGSTVDDSCLDNRYVMVGGDSGILGEWGIEREENEYEGPIPAREALAKGKNAATVRLGLRIGLDQVKSTAVSAGITSPLRNYANAFLGSSEATLEEITLGYTVFANGGSRAKQPHIIEKIVNAEGKQIFKAEPESLKAISREAAWQVTEGLEAAVRTGAASLAFTQFGLKDMPIAGKTGTAYNFTDTYFFGYSSAVTCGVWVGFDRPTRIYRGAFGKDLALPIWTKVMNIASEEFPPVKFDRPGTLKAVEICRRSGLLATPRCSRDSNPNGPSSGTFNEYGTAAQIPTARCNIHGGGVRSYAREYDQEEWPRAAAAIDLSTIRPIAVMTPTVLGLNDVYGAVRPAGHPFEDAIPIARAIPVNAADVEEASHAVAAASETAHPTDVQPSAEPEVRKAEAVRPLDSPLDAPSIQAPTPEPITF